VAAAAAAAAAAVVVAAAAPSPSACRSSLADVMIARLRDRNDAVALTSLKLRPVQLFPGAPASLAVTPPPPLASPTMTLPTSFSSSAPARWWTSSWMSSDTAVC
jgi:hypothetical protein